MSVSFNVTDLSPFDAGEYLRTNPFQEGGNDENKGDTLERVITSSNWFKEAIC